MVFILGNTEVVWYQLRRIRWIWTHRNLVLGQRPTDQKQGDGDTHYRNARGLYITIVSFGTNPVRTMLPLSKQEYAQSEESRPFFIPNISSIIFFIIPGSAARKICNSMRTDIWISFCSPVKTLLYLSSQESVRDVKFLGSLTDSRSSVWMNHFQSIHFRFSIPNTMHWF